MRRRWCWLVCGLAACGDDPTNVAPPPAATVPSLSAVVPDRVFVGRDARIEISGDATTFARGTTVDFGPDVTVHSVAIASPTSLFADVTVSAAAAAGLVNVAVIDPELRPLVLAAGLDIEPPLVATATGTLAQGSIVKLHVANQDFDHPFAVPDLDIEPPVGTALVGIDSASAFELDATFTIDVDAQPGELVINSGPPGDALRLSAGTLEVAPRTAIPLVPNTVTTGGALDRFATALYELTPAAAPSVALATIDTGQFTMLPASGHWAEALSSSPVTSFVQLDPAVLTTGKYYLVYGFAPLPVDAYQVRAGDLSLVETDETATANDTGASAQPLAVPGLFANATLSSSDAVDYVTFPVAPADVGKTVRVITRGDASTRIDVFADQDATISLGASAGAPADDFTSSPIPEGTTAIYVKFSAAADVDYLAAIFLNQ